MAGFLEKLKMIGRPGEEDYAEVDLGQFDEEVHTPDIVLRVADLSSMDVLPEIKQEIYGGNIIIVDLVGMKRDKISLDRAIGDMKKAVDEVSGDIAGVGDDMVVIVPSGIRIDREKIIGGKD